jgi:hypothetical protein
MRAFALASAVALAAPILPLVAQSPWKLSIGTTGGRETVRSRTASVRERLSGPVFTGEAVVTRDRLALRVRYGQGQVTADTGMVMARDVAEGEALLGYTARPWLTFWLGPHARTYGTALGDQRWLFWSARVNARGSLFPGRVESFVELWQAVAGNVSRPAASASGRGAEAGLHVRLATRPFWGRLAYRIEQSRVDSGRRETVEAVTLTVGYVPLR